MVPNSTSKSFHLALSWFHSAGICLVSHSWGKRWWPSPMWLKTFIGLCPSNTEWKPIWVLSSSVYDSFLTPQLLLRSILLCVLSWPGLQTWRGRWGTCPSWNIRERVPDIAAFTLFLMSPASYRPLALPAWFTFSLRVYRLSYRKAVPSDIPKYCISENEWWYSLLSWKWKKKKSSQWCL